MATNKYVLGSLILVVLASSYYIMLPEEVKLLVSETSSTFYVWEDKWVVSGIETNKLYNGNKLFTATNRIVTNNINDNKTNITRTANFGKSQIIDTYIFDGNENDKELFPIEETHKIINGTGLIYQYQVTKLIYNEGNKEVKDLNEYSFGRNMKIEWEGKPYYAKITNQTGGYGTLTLKWKVNSDDEVFKIRLFDPWWNTSWSYVRPITITNTSVLLDYQVNILLNSTYIPNLNWSNNGNDTRYTYCSDNTTVLSYWIENWNNATSPNNASIWVRTNQSSICMWYGNPTATSQSNGTKVFDIFDDFDDGIFDTANWIAQSAERPQGTGTITESNGLINISCGVNGRNYGIMSKKEIQSNYSVVVFKVSNRSATTPTMTWTFGYSNSSTAGNFSGIFFDNYYVASPGFGVRFLKLVNGTYVSTDAYKVVLFDDTSAKLSVTRNGSYIRLDNYTSTINYSVSTGLNNFSNNYFFLGGRPNSAALGWQTYDWIYGRKLMSPEPTTSIGAEESQTSNPPIVLTPNPFTNTTLHGHNNYIGNITITAGIDLNNIVMSSLGGDLGTSCSGCSILYNPSTISSISSGNNRQVNITVVVPFGQSPNTLWTNIYATADEAYNTTNMSITIQSNTSMNISNSSLGIYNISYPNNNGNLKNLTIHNTGNRKIYNISNNITSSNITSLITFSNFSFNLSVLGTQNIQINYTIPTNTPDGLYTYTIYYINNSMTPISRYVTFSLNISGFVKSENITLYLNGTSADKFYELGNSINITACSNVTGTTVYINTTHPSLTNPIVNGTTCATYLWNTSNVVLNQFNDTTLSQNHSANNISGITINSVTDLQSGSMYLRGYLNSIICYQEFANINSCSNNGLGSYFNGDLTALYDQSNAYDGDWGTYAWGNSIKGFYINYTKPSATSLNSSKWEVKDSNGDANITLNNNCFNRSVLQLRVRVVNEEYRVYWECYNGATWDILRNTASNPNYIYEEAMWWNTTQAYPTNLSIAIGNDAQNYWLPYMTLQDTYAITNVFKTNVAIKNLTFSRGGTNVTYIQTPCNSQANSLSWNVSGGNGTQNLNKVDGLTSKSLVFSTENSSNTFNLYLPKSSTVATAPVNITLTGSPYYSSAGTLSGGNTNPDVQPYSGYKQTASTPYDGSSIYLYGATYAGGSCTTTSLTLSLVGTSGTKAYCTSLSSYICGQYYYYSCTVSVTGLQPAENVWVTVSDEAGNPPAKSLSGDWAATYFSNLNQYAFNNATNITIWQNGTNLNYQYLLELNSSVTLKVNLSSTNMNSYLTTCTQDSCPIPYTMRTTKRGNVTISGVNVDYTNSISNITFDVANDGEIDASISGNNIPNNNVTIGQTGLNAINSYVVSHCVNNSVSVPIVATSETAGTMSLSNLVGNFSINPVSLNMSAFTNYMSNQPRTMSTYSYCYQETANVSTSCGGLSNGSYMFDETNILYINYTIPSTANNNSFWKVKHEEFKQEYNVSVSSCMRKIGNTLQLRFISDENALNVTSYGQCFNSTSWIDVTPRNYSLVSSGAYSCGTSINDIIDGNWNTGTFWSTYSAPSKWSCYTANGIYNHIIYEEAMWWNITTPIYPLITNIQVPIKYTADNWGILNTYSLAINALTDYNYTFTGWSDSLHNATQTVKLIWSNFSMKFPQTWIEYTEFVPKSITSKNVTPTGQTDSNPIYNFTYLAREQPMNISIWLNESINSCVNITASTTSNKTDGRFINTTSSNQIVSFNSSSTKGIWMWADLGCSYPIARWLSPNFMISSKCESCN